MFDVLPESPAEVVDVPGAAAPSMKAESGDGVVDEEDDVSLSQEVMISSDGCQSADGLESVDLSLSPDESCPDKLRDGGHDVFDDAGVGVDHHCADASCALCVGVEDDGRLAEGS